MDSEWSVDWESISTPGELLVLLLSQLTPQVEAAISAGNLILSGGVQVIAPVSAFLFSAANAGDFLWPSAQRGRNRHGIAASFPNRARDMRHLLGLPDEEPSELDSIRNDLTHADERIEELYLEDPNASLIFWGVGTVVAGGPRHYMNFDPPTGVLHSLGHEISLTDMVAWLVDLLDRISKVSIQLFFRSDALGISTDVGPNVVE